MRSWGSGRGRGSGTAGRKGISRARFLAGAGAAGVAGAGGLWAANQAGATRSGPVPDGPGPDGPDPDGPDPDGPAGHDHRGLTYRGVCYEVLDGETPATSWNAVRMREDVRVIKDELHAGTVQIFGDGVERLTATATEAAEHGLHVWLQPRLADRPESEILDQLAETGRYAERMRRQGAEVHLSVGCEFYLFVPGIVPGDTALERVENMLDGTYDKEKTARLMREFVARSAAVGRSVFNGELTYGAAHGDEVDWDLFDIVSVDYYAYHPRRADYVRELKPYRRWGKPVAIAECGTCTFSGAPEQGGMGWHNVDYEKQPPEIKGGLVRSERAQAAYLADVFGVFESMGLYSATAYQFVTPDAPHRAKPLYDLDMVGYSLVKTVKDAPGDPDSDWHWEPKQSFHTLARHFARAARSGGARR